MIIDTTELARRLGVTRGRAIQLINAGRIPGAVKVGKAERGVWAVEVDDDSDAPPVVLPTERQVKRRQSGQSRSAGPIGPCWIQSAAVWRRCLAAGGRLSDVRRRQR